MLAYSALRWNQNGPHISRLDRLTTNYLIYVASSLILVLGGSLIYFNFIEIVMDPAFVICYSIIIQCHLHLFCVSDFLFRISQSEKLFLFTIFESVASAVVLFVFLDVYVYVYALVALVLAKAFFFHSILSHANS